MLSFQVIPEPMGGPDKEKGSVTFSVLEAECLEVTALTCPGEALLCPCTISSSLLHTEEPVVFYRQLESAVA